MITAPPSGTGGAAPRLRSMTDGTARDSCTTPTKGPATRRSSCSRARSARPWRCGCRSSTLAGPFRVIRIDHRGHGGSPAPPGPYAMPDLAADVVELLDELELEQVAFCGLSLGGMVGMYLGSEHAAPAHQPHALLHHRRTSPTSRRGTERIAAVEADGTAGIADTVVSRWFTPEWAAAHPDVVTALRDQIAGTSDTGYLGLLPGASPRGTTATRLAAVSVPTLVIGGVGRPLHTRRPARPHARRRHPRRPAGGARPAPTSPRSRARRAASRLIAEHAVDHNFITTPD